MRLDYYYFATPRACGGIVFDEHDVVVGGCPYYRSILKGKHFNEVISWAESLGWYVLNPLMLDEDKEEA